MPKKRAMSSEQASQVKRAGHRNENDFAALIGGRIHGGSHTDKRDVMDAQDRSHSVKSGTWWQVFLYSRKRLETNTMFQGLKLADIMIGCLDCYPERREDYLSDKITVKKKLQSYMRDLLEELDKPRTFQAFLEKALFEGGNADYLSIFLGPAKEAIQNKTFHVFHKNDVALALSSNVTLRNSKAQNPTQMDDQKVVFRSNFHRRIIGEIEDRHDSNLHYREMKCRLNAQDVFDILTSEITGKDRKNDHVIAYGKAAKTFSIRKSPRS